LLQMTLFLLTAGILLLTPLLSHSASCENGVYLESRWLNGFEKSHFDSLLGRIQEKNLKDLYFKLEKKHLRRRHFKILSAISKAHPEVRFHAWFGKILCDSDRKTKCIRLNDPIDWKETLRQATRVFKSDFDYLHINFEPISDRDHLFIRFLKMLKQVKPKNKGISLAGYFLRPEDPRITQLFDSNKKTPYFWSRDFYQKVMNEIDHLTVMNYDTGLSKAYSDFTAWHTRRILEMGKDLQIRIGIPAYDIGRPGLFDPSVENLTSALEGLQQYKGPEGCRPGFGVTIFRWDEISPEEWKSFKF